jgi:catechol 2,3-dioxygenase-like lactoylglutathione lyase family enzyme
MKKVPTEFRRVTLMVRRMDTSLRIYRDILGMEVYYDQQVKVSLPGSPAGAQRVPARLVILKCNDPYIGMLGLMELEEAREAAPPEPSSDAHLGRGQAVFVMEHENVETAYERLRDIEGLTVVDEPHVSEFPRPGGGVLRVEGIRFVDPDGYFVDLNQFVE